MRLLTDYRQWYDGVFDDRPPEFHRRAFTEGGLAKREQLRLFESLGLRVPLHGTVSDLESRLAEIGRGTAVPVEALAGVRLVVYLNEVAHRGEGKRLLPLVEARQLHPNHYATVFRSDATPGTVFRLVRFGRLEFWLRQTGRAGEWRSNLDDSEVVVAKTPAATSNPIPRGLWAIDFVPSCEGLLAIDFNTAPELGTLGETGRLTECEVREELDWLASSAPAHLLQF